LTRTHRILIGIVVAGAVVIAAIGFAGSYAAVRTLALHKGFGWFANVFPIGVDAGIVVLLALDLLLTWLRIPFPLLRQTAWLLTGATIAFNGAAAWPDPLGVGMHAIIPVLFVVCVEAARHAIGRVADITADKHMESVRITRWLLAPLPTFRLWRRMKLWELRSYEEVIRREQDRLVYRARLRARYGVNWRRRAPIEAIMPLRLARYGVPLSETADAGLEAAGIDLSAGPVLAVAETRPAALTKGEAAEEAGAAAAEGAQGAQAAGAAGNGQRLNGVNGVNGQAPAASGPNGQGPAGPGDEDWEQVLAQVRAQDQEQQLYERRLYEQQMYEQQQLQPHDSPWFAPPQAQGHPYGQAVYAGQQQFADGQFPQEQFPQGPYPPEQFPQGQGPQGPLAEGQFPQGQGGPGPFPQGQGPQQAQGGDVPPNAEQGPQGQEQPQVMVPAGPNRTRPLGNVGLDGAPADGPEEPQAVPQTEPEAAPETAVADEPQPEAVTYPRGGLRLPEDVPTEEAYFAAYRQYVRERGSFPNTRQLARLLEEAYTGNSPEERELVAALRELRYRFNSESEAEYIP
jgi:hypothetical protein